MYVTFRVCMHIAFRVCMHLTFRVCMHVTFELCMHVIFGNITVLPRQRLLVLKQCQRKSTINQLNQLNPRMIPRSQIILGDL